MSVVGLIALVAAGSMFGTPVAGRAVDVRGPDRVSLICMLGGIGAAGVLAFGDIGGAAGLVLLVLGMLLLDVAIQCGQVANQARIFALRPAARSRLNTAYMTCVFLGGSAGSTLGVRAYAWLGWAGVCGLVAILAAIALARHAAHLAGGRVPGERYPRHSGLRSGALAPDQVADAVGDGDGQDAQ